MALKAKISTEEHESLSEDVKGHYRQDGDKFVLDVISIDGLVLENVDGLKSTVSKLRTSEKNLNSNLSQTQSTLNELKSKYEGIDADQARDLMGKVDEIKNWNGETKVREAVKSAENKHKSILEQLTKSHSEKVSSLEDELADAQTQLQAAIVDSKIIEAISKSNGNVDLLMPHVRSQVNMVQNSSGKWVPEVVDKAGNARIGDSAGNNMTITQLVEEMKSKETFAACFSGANSTGSGNTSSNSDGTSTSRNNTDRSKKTIKASDERAKSANLEDIAAGKVQVDMSS